MTSALAFERVYQDVDVLAHAGLDAATFLAEVYASMQRAVPSVAACVATLDPATQLATGAFKFGELEGRNETDQLWGLLEYGDPEPTSFSELVRSGLNAVGMYLATGGDVKTSRRVRELVQSGLDCADELRVVAKEGGTSWGGVAMFRDTAYEEAEIEFVSSLSALLARGLRVGILVRLAAGTDSAPTPRGPAVAVFDPKGRLCEASIGAEKRLAELSVDADAPAPYAVVSSLVAAAWRYAAGTTDVLPSSRIRLRSGDWVVLHASPLTATGGSRSRVVVTIEEARPPEIVPIVVAAFNLTARERDVTQLVLRGVDTREIAAALHLSPHTVQDHLKSIFNKTGVSTRRELVARVFFEQYVPRLGDSLSPAGSFLH